MSTRVVTVTIPKHFDHTGESISTTATATATTTIENNDDGKGTTAPSIRSKSTYSYMVCDDPNNHSPFLNPTAAEGCSAGNNNSGSSDSTTSTGSTTTNRTRDCGNDGCKSDMLLQQKQLRHNHPPPKNKNNFDWPSRWTTPRWILQSIALMDQLLVSWWLMAVLDAWHKYVPLRVKRKLCFWAWERYVAIHTLVACRWMGGYKDDRFYRSARLRSCSRSRSPAAAAKTEGCSCSCDDRFVSDEYKAYSTLCYPSQFLVIDVPRMRFALSQLNVVSKNDIPSEETVERVLDDTGGCNEDEHEDETASIVPDSQRDHQTVRGLYVTNSKQKQKQKRNPTTRTVLFWIYGGAYLAGDAEGNLSLANEIMEDCNADAVFIPEYRLAPEAKIDDVLWDVAWAYRHLLRRLQMEQQQQQQQQQATTNDDDDDDQQRATTTTTTTTTNIVFVGISSGGALALRLLQMLRDRSAKQDQPMHPTILEPLVDDLLSQTRSTGAKIKGSVLFGPYVDYREPQPPSGSFVQNSRYDWVVTQAVQDSGLPYLHQFIPPVEEDLRARSTTDGDNSDNGSDGPVYNANGRRRYSPLTHDMTGLPPLCLIVSEHEACYDMTIEIVNKARQTQTQTQTGTATAGSPPTDVTVAVWKHMCHVFSMMQALLPEGKASMDFVKTWIRSKTADDATE